jgi:ribA/ribD-fused uncharacterized protein
VYDENPFINQNVPKEKITISGLPLNYDLDVIKGYFQDLEIELLSEIKHYYIRDENNQLTKFKNGKLFVFAKGPISPLLPRNTKIAGYHCNLYHDGQFKSHCKLCKVPGHSQGDENCPSKLEEGQHITPFSSENNVFSNFYPCKISAFGESFESSESCYQWYKAREAGRPDLAEDIKNAKHAGEAKRLSYNIPKVALESWKTKEVEVMKNIIELKAEQVAEFRDALIGSNDEYLVEATRNKFWGSGISSELTKASNPCTWPGLNTLGRLLMEVRNQLISSKTEEKQQETSTPRSRNVKKNTRITSSRSLTPIHRRPLDRWFAENSPKRRASKTPEDQNTSKAQRLVDNS